MDIRYNYPNPVLLLRLPVTPLKSLHIYLAIEENTSTFQISCLSPLDFERASRLVLNLKVVFIVLHTGFQLSFSYESGIIAHRMVQCHCHPSLFSKLFKVEYTSEAIAIYIFHTLVYGTFTCMYDLMLGGGFCRVFLMESRFSPDLWFKDRTTRRRFQGFTLCFVDFLLLVNYIYKQYNFYLILHSCILVYFQFTSTPCLLLFFQSESLS